MADRSLRYPVWPMSGWHVQQILKLMAHRLTDAPILLMADSDTVFVRSPRSRRICSMKPGGFASSGWNTVLRSIILCSACAIRLA